MTTDPTAEPLRFAYWVPNVSGGLVTSTIEQRTDWSFEYNRKLARLAEWAGFDYALSQVRYTASYGAEYQHESTGFSLALLLATERLKLIAAIHPGLWQPGVLAKWVATADHLSGGRVAVNVVSGWFKDEFRQLGEPWLEHDERYRRTAEFILRAEADLDRGRGQPRRRLLPDPGLQPQAQAAVLAGPPAPGDLPGRQLHRRAAQRRPAVRLVLLQRQGLRRRPRAARPSCGKNAAAVGRHATGRGSG